MNQENEKLKNDFLCELTKLMVNHNVTVAEFGGYENDSPRFFFKYNTDIDFNDEVNGIIQNLYL